MLPLTVVTSVLLPFLIFIHHIATHDQWPPMSLPYCYHRCHHHHYCCHHQCFHHYCCQSSMIVSYNRCYCLPLMLPTLLLYQNVVITYCCCYCCNHCVATYSHGRHHCRCHPRSLSPSLSLEFQLTPCCCQIVLQPPSTVVVKVVKGSGSDGIHAKSESKFGRKKFRLHPNLNSNQIHTHSKIAIQTETCYI